jgi:LPS-assembly protein
MLRTLPALLACALGLSVSVSAQQESPNYKVSAEVQERISETHLKFTGGVELEQEDTTLYADEVEIFTDQDRALASGNVVVSQGRNRIAADRADFNTRTRMGTFYNATGIATIQPPRQNAPTTGFVAPQATNQENDVYFFGEQVEKIGPKKYRISNGGFSTCVQPTPRWELSADTVILNIDHYTLLRQAIFKVKGVPLLYTPFIYYPTKEEDRATGILLPTYGASTIRGQTIHNAFFWAINRSHDATILHDWFSKTGQGLGGEYRYALATGDGNLTAYSLNQRSSSYTLGGGGTAELPGSRTYEIRGNANQLLPMNFRARGQANYFSSFETMQTFNTNIYDASRSQRSFGGNVVGSWRGYSLNGTFDRNENFYNQTSSVVTGSTPRITVNRTERPISANSPVYVAMNGEFVRLLRQRNSDDLEIDSGLTRLDFSPQIRYPFKRWQFFTVSSSLTWRGTVYTRSQDPTTTDPDTRLPLIVDDLLGRQYFSLQAQIKGPSFLRVWDTPSSGYAERFKHTIEPFLNVSRTSAIKNYSQIVKTDSVDGVVGNATSYTYGINNRLYAKRRIGATSRAQEIVNVAITQSYYSDERQAQYDTQYATTGVGAPPNHFSPVSLSVRATPTNDFNATLRAEFDSKYHEFRTINVQGNYNWSGRLQSSVGWSQRYFIEELPGFNDPRFLDHYLNVSSNVHTLDNRVGVNYSFNYNILRSAMLQQRIQAFYNAQCCGIAFELQRFNFGASSTLPADNRFFLSFTLAGLGNFAPFSGGMSGVPR